MKDLKQLLENNKTWSTRKTTDDPGFFRALAEQQNPDYLWIGCSDSRVPATQLLGLSAGDLFVHRNVANVVVHTDFNCLSVLQFAVDILKVSHIIVCGHDGCGGVKAAMENLQLGLLDNWLRHVQDVVHTHNVMLSKIDDYDRRLNTLCALNVIEQVLNVSRTTIVQTAWGRGQDLTIHGLIYGIGDGLLRDLDIRVTNSSEVSEVYEKAVRAVGDNQL